MVEQKGKGMRAQRVLAIKGIELVWEGSETLRMEWAKERG